MLSGFKFLEFGKYSKPAANTDALLFLHDIWCGYDEIIAAKFNGVDFYSSSGVKIHSSFIAGWLPLPVKLAYDSSASILP